MQDIHLYKLIYMFIYLILKLKCVRVLRGLVKKEPEFVHFSIATKSDIQIDHHILCSLYFCLALASSAKDGN